MGHCFCSTKKGTQKRPLDTKAVVTEVLPLENRAPEGTDNRDKRYWSLRTYMCPFLPGLPGES